MFSKAQFDALEKEGMTRAWDGLGGSHTFVTYPPLDALQPLAPEPVLSNFPAVGGFNLYVHLPFCEMSCPFCPYERHVIAEPESAINSYLDALEKEIELVAGRLDGGAVESVYIGGGTATVLSEKQTEALLRNLRTHFSFGNDTVLCVETSPNALIQNPSKIDLLKTLGVRRLSVGVQTLAENSLRSEGRTHGPKETLKILERVIRDMEVVNVDLMQDMPGQSDDDLKQDIDRIATLQPSQVTWYVERLRKWHGGFPDSYQSISRRLWVRDRMAESGYAARPGGRFVRAGSVDDRFKKVRCGLDSHLVGLGASAYGHVPGYFYRNTIDTGAYVRSASAGRSPIGLGAALRDVDITASRIASGIRWGVALNQLPGPAEYVSAAQRKIEMLLRHNLVRFDSESKTHQITLDGPGWAYEEEICSLFVPQDVVERIRSKNLPWWLGKTPV